MVSCAQLAFLLALLSCHNCEKTQNSRLNYFDIDLIHFAAEDRRGNVVVSPASIKSTLAMILEGARGSTASEIRSALRLSPNKVEFREQLNLYLSLLQGTKNSNTILKNTNAIFVSENLKLNQDYEAMLKNVYVTEVCKINFKDPLLASEIINQRINNNTKGLITDIIEPTFLSPMTELLLTNALYFKASWKNSFDPRSTTGGCFFHLGLCKTVAMMELHAELNYAYVDNLRAHALELPYEGEQHSMILLVPQEREGLLPLIRDLPYMSLPQVSALLEPTDVTLILPKFTVNYTEDIVASLRKMRINTLFSTGANLSGIFIGNSAHVSNLVHKVHISVDETGTVAAAASAGIVIPLIHNDVEIRVDRPFLFFIRDNKQGLVLFEGKIEEPTPFMDMKGLNGQSTRKGVVNHDKRFPDFKAVASIVDDNGIETALKYWELIRAKL